VFVDDNPVEIARIHAAHPALPCIQVERPPLHFVEQLAALRLFDRLTVTAEDRSRGDFYQRERERRELKAGAATIEEFFAGLAQRLTVFESHAPHVARIAQLTQRTNQFNMTTLRLGEDEVQRMMVDADYLLVTAALIDRLGDSGIVGYLQVRKSPGGWFIENFLLSCRVLGRGVEQALIDFVSARAAASGVTELAAAYARTVKNTPFADFYMRSGFEVAGEDGERRIFRCDPTRRPPGVHPMEIIVHGT
jgi:FkbH-like protein